MLNKQLKRRITAFALTGLCVINQGVMPVAAAEDATEKEEVVYAMLDGDGTVNGVYVVNSFTDKNIIDYGDYTSIRNLTTTDEINTDGDQITIHTDADKIYYQGNLESKDIPWNIQIQYFMDGTEYTAEEIAGMNGALEIQIHVTQNETCTDNFWKGYALQATLAFDSQKCTNITAEGATIANVGSKKQLSYIILPGKGADLTITADAKEFEMDEISINGTKLSLDFEVENQSLTDQIEEIKDAVSSLNDGAGELKDGTAEFTTGTKDMYDGTVDLQSGASKLTSGTESLQKGIKKVQTALNTLNGTSGTLTNGSGEVLKALTTIQTSLENVSMESKDLAALSKASTKINTGISSLTAGLGKIEESIQTYQASLKKAGLTNIDDYVAQHKKLIQALNITDTQRKMYAAYTSHGTQGVMQKMKELVGAGNSEATALYKEYAQAGNDASVITAYVTEAGKVINIETVLKADTNYIQGSNQLIRGIDAALDKKTGELMKGALSLKENYATFDTTIQSMVTSLGSLAENMTALKNGIDTLVTKYKELDTGIGAYTQAVADITEGYAKIYDGSLELTEGTSKLYNGTNDLVDGARKLYQGSEDLDSGTKELAEGTGEFQDKTKDMDTKVSDEIKATIDEMTGKEVETVSFVSDKNTNVDSVLFVLKAPAIEQEEEEAVVEEKEQSSSIWQKFLNLFGL